MYIAERLRQFRELKNFSQGDIEQRTGLLRCYISRVENGHTVPSIETLEKLSRALEIPMYQLFYEGSSLPEPVRQVKNDKLDWASHGKGQRLFRKITLAVARMEKNERTLFLHIASKMAGRSHKVQT